jgi:RepA leader peptide Tap
MRCLPGTGKDKTPIIFPFLGGKKINGVLRNCIEAVALCGEYSFMPGKLQDLLSVLLLCNISAGRND